MHQYLYKYFSLYKKLELPGIGLLQAETKPAQIEFADKMLLAPVSYISFQEDEDIANTKFPLFLANETGLEKHEAANRFIYFINEIKTAVQAGVAVQFEGIGQLSRIGENYSFAPKDLLQNFFPDITAERAIREHATHNVRVGESEKTSVEMQEILHHKIEKDNWWIAAVVLAIAGISAIVYYYTSR